MISDNNHNHDPFIVHLPRIAQPLFEEELGREENFRPVIKSRKYNLLKMKELRGHIEKDKRMGRTESSDSRRLKDEEGLQASHTNAYLTTRN